MSDLTAYFAESRCPECGFVNYFHDDYCSRAPHCRDCGSPFNPVQRGECSRCGSDAGALTPPTTPHADDRNEAGQMAEQEPIPRHPATEACADDCPTWLHSKAECTCDTGMFCEHGHHIQDPESCPGCWTPATPHADDGNEES